VLAVSLPGDGFGVAEDAAVRARLSVVDSSRFCSDRGPSFGSALAKRKCSLGRFAADQLEAEAEAAVQ